MTVKVLGHIFSKVEPIIKDLHIYYICFKKIALFMPLLTVNKRNLIFAKQGQIKVRVLPLSGYNCQHLYMSGAYMQDYRVSIIFLKIKKYKILLHFLV